MARSSAQFAGELASCGARRINVSFDTLDRAQFKAITRRGDLDRVLAGIDAARQAGLRGTLNQPDRYFPIGLSSVDE
jgi:cyclic pyranopterin phosphate synthase